MSAQANITVFDGASTPVTHTLVGLGTKFDPLLGDIAIWREDLASLPQMAQVKVTAFKKLLKTGVERLEIRVEVPVMEAVGAQNAFGYTAAPKVAHVVSIASVCYFHPRATLNDRKLAKQILANLLNNVSTSVATATAGPAAELIHSSIMPS